MQSVSAAVGSHVSRTTSALPVRLQPLGLPDQDGFNLHLQLRHLSLNPCEGELHGRIGLHIDHVDHFCHLHFWICFRIRILMKPAKEIKLSMCILFSLPCPAKSEKSMEIYNTQPEKRYDYNIILFFHSTDEKLQIIIMLLVCFSCELIQFLSKAVRAIHFIIIHTALNGQPTTTWTWFGEKSCIKQEIGACETYRSQSPRNKSWSVTLRAKRGLTFWS